MWEEIIARWPDLVVNAVGVLLGGIGALTLARWRMQHQTASERRRMREHVSTSLEWLYLEASENHELVTELRRVLTRGSTARADLLRWAGSIAAALAFDAHADLIRSGYHRKLTPDAERAVLKTYQATSTLRNLLRQAEPAVQFYVNCCGEEEAAQRLMQDLHAQTEETEAELVALRTLLPAVRRDLAPEPAATGGAA